MGRKDKSSKSVEKKAQRLAMEKKMNERVAIVKAANEVPDPISLLPSFSAFKKNGLELKLETKRVADLDEETKVWLMDLLSTNMKKLYEESEWGWKEKNKTDEMMDESAWYLVAREAESGSPVAFSHFRYDMDYDDEVLYVYEIQLEQGVRRKGLGRFMMMILELLSVKADMRKIMLTGFKHNPNAQRFFKEQMKFENDETNFEDDIYEQADYEILSKFNKRKIAREEAAAGATGENSSAVANADTTKA